MTKKQGTWKATRGTQVITRRDALVFGAAAATTLWLPDGLIRSASAQTSFDYYIGPNGSDSNPGTQSQPWALTALNSKRSTYAGKRVGLLDGTYGLITLMGQPSTTSGASQRGRLRIAGGSAGSPTILAAVNARQAIIDWQRSLQSNTSMESSMEPGGNYVTIDGLVFDNNNYQCIVNNSSGGTGYDYLTVKNCLFRNQSFELLPSSGQNSCMVYTQGGDHILISNCLFLGGDAVSDSNRHNAIMGYTPTTDFIIEYCTFISSKLGCDVIHFKQNGVTDGVIRNCYFDRSAVTQTTQGGYCVKFEGVSDTSDVFEMYNNVIVSGGSTARSIFHAQPGTGGTCTIRDNTFVGPWTNDGCISSVYSRMPTQFNCYRNIFHRVSGTGGSYGDVNVYSIATTGAMDYNYFSSAPKFTIGDVSVAYLTLALWQAASGKDANSVVGSNPMFAATGAEAALYQLQAGSPCKTLGPGGTEIGAWRGVGQVGCSFSGGLVKVPVAPTISVS